MWLFALLFPFLTNSANCILYIDRVEVESNPAVASMLVDYMHDAKGNSVTNATFTTFVTITKSLLYLKMKVAENENDKEFKRQLISSVVDVDKVLKGFQSNFLISRFFAAFRKGMDLNFQHPLAPVGSFNFMRTSFWSILYQGVYKFVNITFTGPSTILFHNISGMVDLRFVGKIKGSSSNKFIAHMVYYGGYRPNWMFKRNVLKIFEYQLNHYNGRFKQLFF